MSEHDEDRWETIEYDTVAAERAERRARRNDDCWARPKEPCRCVALPCAFRLQRIAGTHTFAPHALVHADTKHFAPPVKIDWRHHLRALLRRIRVFLGV